MINGQIAWRSLPSILLDRITHKHFGFIFQLCVNVTTTHYLFTNNLIKNQNQNNVTFNLIIQKFVVKHFAVAMMI